MLKKFVENATKSQDIFTTLTKFKISQSPCIDSSILLEH
jgi:hypothetical protein